ncbi:hypothetical protein [Mucilaginibacter jinjuensis]|uniref:HTH araC/xylS-type domain-containing protein n=1 Tax=Mucilaginibacter jinjuensis TaxID=1176721 RepID=A0ABY7TBF3_9SPHI|nr:hypothetical protein [Mucilaginibacter jinjuensis]WCT13281.1 hypothetical protein PQO05_04965 [Mucilaginibacter jinjuensis]
MHIGLYELALLGTVFVGLAFSVLLLLTKKGNEAANRILGLILIVMVMEMIRALYIDVQPKLPIFSLALGPLIRFYVRSITRLNPKFRFRSLLHFCPLLLSAIIDVLYTPSFPGLTPVFRLIVFISDFIYGYAAHKQIEDFSRGLKFNGSDRYRLKLRWLKKLLKVFAILWLSLIPFTIIGYPDPVYFLLTTLAIGTAGMSILRPEINAPADDPYFLKLPSPDDVKYKADWLKRRVKNEGYYSDPELSLTSLAGKLGLTTHELSRIINTVLKKSFNDFINQYRVADVARKMKDPPFDQLTLQGIAYDGRF